MMVRTCMMEVTLLAISGMPPAFHESSVDVILDLYAIAVTFLRSCSLKDIGTGWCIVR